MQYIWDAAVAAGGLAFLGSLIDFVMSRRSKAELKAKLEHWWLRFEYVTWGTFGRREADAAVALLDRWAGPRLWSWKRWRFALLVNLALCTLAVSYVLVWIWLSPWPYRLQIEIILIPLALAPGIIVTFALSLSATRYLALLVGRSCTGTIWDAGIVLLLILAHWFFLAYWSVFTYVLQTVPVSVIRNGWEQVLDWRWESVLAPVMPRLVWGWFPVPELGFFFVRHPQESAHLYKALVDILSNGLRLGFAAVFLASFLFRPLIQKPISWVWLRIVDSTLPFFTLSFGIAGGLLKFAQSLWR